MQIAVVGASQCSPEVARTAEKVGRAIARAGAILVCGGLGGVMEAAARGSREEGGFNLGLLPGPSRAAANAYMSCTVAT
ncbi:MAG: TIGR00725 family protein, partial [Acidobacteriota bacterium]